MDYSAAAADPALHGSSPWGSSSPRANRSSFPGPGSESPESPAATPQHSHSHSQDSISTNPFANEAGPPAAPETQLPPPEIPPTREQPQGGVGPSLQETTQQRQQQQMRPGAARYHSARQQRPVPAYKLQAKVTALERTGRKDPVIRFDVYVGFSP